MRLRLEWIVGLFVVVGCVRDNPAFDDLTVGVAEATGTSEEATTKEETGSASSSTGDGDPTGDGDGDPPGDGDGEPPGDGDGEPPGDGDGDTPGDGDGDFPGDGDGDFPGDGDGDFPGDGDGDFPGDGDGDGNLCLGVVPDDDGCLMCVADFCCNDATLDCLVSDDCSCFLSCMLAINDVQACSFDCEPSDDSLALAGEIGDCAFNGCGNFCL